MKTTLLALVALFGITTSAQAEQYSFYVTHADRVSTAQVQFGSLVQKNILVDTSTKRVRLSLSPICGAGLPCPEMIKMVNFTMTNVQKQGSLIVRVKAEGYVMINGLNTYTTVEIVQNANNATTIQVTSVLQRETSAKAVSVFYGSPAQESSMLF
jgi:hypothetical protein